MHDRPIQQTKKDMHQARARSNLNLKLLRNYLYNGHEEWESHERVVNTMKMDPVFDKSQRDFLPRTERYKRGLSMMNRIYELGSKNHWSSAEYSLAVRLVDEASPMVLHSVAFEPVLNSQGSPELIAQWGNLVANRGILGCYLQTELGHGTQVSCLETTATYLPSTQEFQINSPTLTSSKWWIGAGGKTSTHGVVQAKLILPNGEDVGPHLFFVQLRSLKDHKLLPGINLGDIGPKTMNGSAALDHGFARFDHVRIPKSQMLSKFATVTEEGKYVPAPHAKLSYGGMLYIRSTMVTSGGWSIAKAATVSIRYAHVRRQGNPSELTGLEPQVINYPSTYHRLLPILSHAYVFIQLGRQITQSFNQMASRLASGDTSSLAEMHATTSGLKVLISTIGINDIEIARRSMGGHGYSAFSGLGKLYAEYLPSATYEGDNFVLDQQVVRAALKSFMNFLSANDSSTNTLSPSSSYLQLLTPSSKSIKPNLTDVSWNQDSSLPISLLEWRAALIVKDLAEHLSDPDANVYQRVSKAVVDAFVAVLIGQMVRDLDLKFSTNENETKAVRGLYQLYLLTNIESALVDLASFGLLGQSSNDIQKNSRALRRGISELCLEILPNAIGLVDAFGFTDWELDSALGVYDGNVYESLWERVQAEPLNNMEVPPGYQEFIKPMLERGQRIVGKDLSKL